MGATSTSVHTRDTLDWITRDSYARTTYSSMESVFDFEEGLFDSSFSLADLEYAHKIAQIPQDSWNTDGVSLSLKGRRSLKINQGIREYPQHYL